MNRHLLVILGIPLIGFAVLAYPTIQGAKEAGPRTQCRNNLKQIGLALNSYHDKHGCFPPAYLVDKNGKPAHSWRVLLLPYLGRTDLYEEYRFDEPWDGPNNSKLAERMPAVFRCPSYSRHSTWGGFIHRRMPAMTNYVAVIAPQGVFPGAESTTRKQISDGTENTMCVTETHLHAVHWMSPDDTTEEQMLENLAATEKDGANFHVGGTHVLLNHGAARFFSCKMPQATLHAYITRDGGEVIEE